MGTLAAARVDPKLLQIMPKLPILVDKGNITFDNNNKRKRFRLLNSPRAAILDFMTSLHCPIVCIIIVECYFSLVW